MPANIVVPEVGESIVDARIAKWLRKEGDVVAAGDPLVELETDKIDLEVGAPQAGVLSRIDRQRWRRREGRRSARRDRGRGRGQGGRRREAGESTGRAEGESGRGREAPPAARPRSTRATPTARKAAEQNDVDLTPGRAPATPGA